MMLASMSGNPIPDGAIAGTVRTPDGVELRFARWDSPGSSKGTVCVFGGRGEFIEKYFETIGELRQRGFAVATMDWRGQGHSSRQLPDPRKGHVADFAEYEVDLETFMSQAVLPNSPAPYFALTHSMGGAVVLRAMHAGKRWFDRAVLVAPMIDFPRIWIARPARALMRVLRLPGFGKNFVPGGNVDGGRTSRFADNPLTSDPARYARNAALVAHDPTLGIGGPTVDWLNAAFETIAAFQAAGYAAQIDQPIMMLAAGADTIVSTPAIGRFANRLAAGSHLMIEGARHEILQEQDRYRAQVWAAFDAFMPSASI
jgi:lysophospholipase